MAKVMITVKAKADIPGTHQIHGKISKGKSYRIDERHFCDEFFVRPKDFVPVHERAKSEAASAPADKNKTATDKGEQP